MKEKKLSSYLRIIAVGFLLIYLNFSINGINLIPKWIGYLLILMNISILKDRTAYYSYIRILSIFTAVWSAIEWILAIFAVSMNHILISLPTGILFAFFHFLLISNLADFSLEESGQKRLRTSAIVNLVLNLLTLVFLVIPYLQFISLVTGIAELIVIIWIIVELFLLSKAVRYKEEKDMLTDLQRETYYPSFRNDVPYPVENGAAEHNTDDFMHNEDDEAPKES